ncbi:RcnB family protein [Derxia lacustris]|uniref:RcnB family protein n=1 Tax=Derxia lacustris TaxID=764842 RepID=UPI00111C61DF|nr:RcnB family protein [Derxia lacustris]
MTSLPRRRLLAFALAGLALPAFADPPHGHGGGEHGDGRGPGGNGPRGHDDRRDWHDDHRNWSDEERPRGPERREWARGEHMPRGTRVVYVDDWRARGLRRPPPGHRWARVDGQWLLIAVATGVIVDILLHQ